MLYFIVGVIRLIMAVKNIFAKSFLPFHKKSSNIPWNIIEDPLKIVILSLMRLSGFGFLIIFVLLIIFTGINFYTQNNIYKYAIPVIALIYCVGLFLNNYVLYKKTKANAQWKGSIWTIAILIVGILLSIFN